MVPGRDPQAIFLRLYSILLDFNEHLNSLLGIYGGFKWEIFLVVKNKRSSKFKSIFYDI